MARGALRLKYACLTCGLITTERYCPEHKRKDTRLGSTQRGYDSAWRRTRQRYLTTHPLCTQCGAEATDVHHLDGLGPLGPLGHDPANLEALCHSCHSTTTAAEQPAGWNALVR